MSLIDAVVAAGVPPPDDGSRDVKKRYSELLSKHLAAEVARGLRDVGFKGIKPLPGGPGEKEFQGGLGPKRVDVTYSDEQHGLLLAVSIKTISFPEFGKNLKNRFADLCTEAITLHMRFPYSVVCALFAFPARADKDVTKGRTLSTFRRAVKLLATISGREEYTDPDEKFENVALLLYTPAGDKKDKPAVTIVDAKSGRNIGEHDYFVRIREIYNTRNPHAPVGEE